MADGGTINVRILAQVGDTEPTEIGAGQIAVKIVGSPWIGEVALDTTSFREDLARQLHNAADTLLNRER